MSFDKTRFEELRLYCEDIVLKYMPVPEGHNAIVTEAMDYSLRAGGKRIRPILMLLSYRAFGGSEEVVEPFMAALEMIHTYSLIHDDLPAMDNDDLRRGMPTCHKKFGEDIAILAGDGLLNYAYEVACKAFIMKPGDVRVEKAMSILASKPGLNGMLGGQAADVSLTGKKLSADDINYIYENKTAALLICAMTIGAVLAGASDEDISKIRLAAYAVGMAFQVQDDIIDMTGDASVVGKEVGQDERNEKYTYAALHGLDEAKAYVLDMSKKAKDLLEELFSQRNNKAAEDLTGLIMMLVDREK